jgi:uncharacterized protein YecE (DUF72 family)
LVRSVVRVPGLRFAIEEVRLEVYTRRPIVGGGGAAAPSSRVGKVIVPRAAPGYGCGEGRVIRFGPAGWEYPDWAGIVYPKPEPRGFDRLRFLAGFFGTVEVNATFYRPFAADVAARWCERVRDVPAFRFGAKVWRRFTHERDRAYSAEEVAQGRAALDRLHAEHRLGAALLQFPWSFKRDEASEEWLRGLFRAFAGLPLVLEVRHASWDAPEVLAELADAGVGIVNVDQPLFHGSIRPSARVTSPVAYVRVHGRNYKDWFRKGAGRDARYDYLYSAGELEPWVKRVKALAAAPTAAAAPAPSAAVAPVVPTPVVPTHVVPVVPTQSISFPPTAGSGSEVDATAVVPDVYVVTNNHFRGQAAANAKMLESMVEGRKVEAPAELVAHYPDALRPWVIPAANEPTSPELFPQ